MLNRDSLAKQVYIKLKEIIILQNTAGFHMGDRLSETLIAQMFGCSITPVRESLNMLRRDGLVTGSSYRSSSVVSFSRKDAENLFELRSCLEVFALRKAIHLLTKENLDIMNQAQQQYRQAYLDFDQSGIVSHNRVFHDTIITRAGNEMLRSEVNGLAERIAMVRAPIAQKRKKTGDMEYLLQPIKEHERLLKAIEVQNEEEAVAALEAHMNRVLGEVRECYR